MTNKEKTIGRLTNYLPPSDSATKPESKSASFKLLNVKAPKKDYSGRTPEGKVKGAIRRILDAQGIYYFMPATGGYGKSGVWDFCLSVEGRMVQIEAKGKPDDMLTVLQRDNGDEVVEAGAVALVIKTVAHAEEYLPRVIEKIKGGVGYNGGITQYPIVYLPRTRDSF